MAISPSDAIEASFPPRHTAHGVAVGRGNVSMPSSVHVGEQIPIDITFEWNDVENGLPDSGTYQVRTLDGDKLSDEAYAEGTYSVSDSIPTDTAFESVIVDDIGGDNRRTIHFTVVVDSGDFPGINNSGWAPVGGHDVLVSQAPGDDDDGGNGNGDGGGVDAGDVALLGGGLATAAVLAYLFL